MGNNADKGPKKPAISDSQLLQIRQIAESIRYGTLTLIFQDGILVQVDKNEKVRIPRD